MNQKQAFYQSHLWHANENHKRMAEMQRKAGNERLAVASERTALARRIAARNFEGFRGDLKAAVDYGEFAVNTNLC